MARMGHDSERAAIIYQHEARGADSAITSAIDAHIETAKPAGASPATARRKRSSGPLMTHRDQQEANELESHVRRAR
jgi:hypothetical protein